MSEARLFSPRPLATARGAELIREKVSRKPGDFEGMKIKQHTSETLCTRFFARGGKRA